MKKWLFLLTALICLLCVVSLKQIGSSGGGCSSIGDCIADIAENLNGCDYTWGGGHGTPSEREDEYNNNEFTSTCDEGLDCSGLVLTTLAVSGKDIGDTNMDGIANNRTHFDEVTATGDYKRGDIIALKVDSNEFTHGGIITKLEGNNVVDIHTASGNQNNDDPDSINKKNDRNMSTNTYWGENSTHDRVVLRPKGC